MGEPAHHERMASSLESLWQTKSLQPLAPLVHAAWEDGHLTPADLSALRAALEQATWLDADDRSALGGWLDPAAPPAPQAMQVLAREVKALAREIPRARRHPLSSLAEALAERSLDLDRASAARALLLPLDDLLTYSPPEAASTELSARPAADSAHVQRLRAALDGKHAKIRDKVRSLLSEPSFRFAQGLSRAAYRELVLAWCKQLAASDLLALAYPKGLEAGRDIGQFVAAFETLAFFDLSLVVKFGVQFGLFGGTVEALGSERHHALLPAIARAELIGCFAMSERGHGSNVRDLKTVARYDANAREFVIRTPGLAAGKEWIGNAAQHASVAIVFAQLETAGESYGVHAFLVPIRNADGTLKPGVRVEDCGEKMGLNGVDNGRLWFDDVRVEKGALLDRFGQVADDGSYQSAIPSSGKRFFTMLGTLVGGRVSVAAGALSAAKAGLVIALSYGAWRSQFPDESGREKPLLDYVTHQRRLLPRLAAAYAFSFAQHELVRRFSDLARDDDTRAVETLAAGLKALSTWQAIDTLQQCRECCGGQGYLSENRIDALRVDTDVFTTFEGDNTVLLSLVAKELLFAFRSALRESPFKTVGRALVEHLRSALGDHPLEAGRAHADALLSPEFHLEALRFRERSLLESLTKRLFARTARGVDAQAAFEQCQDHALALARAHVEHFVLSSFQQAAADDPMLGRLCAVYGLWRIESDLAWFLENGYLSASHSRAIRKELNLALATLRPDVLTLVDGLGIPPTCLGPLADYDYLARTGLISDPIVASPTTIA
jgi:acyl-CoA oxidase